MALTGSECEMYDAWITEYNDCGIGIGRADRQLWLTVGKLGSFFGLDDAPGKLGRPRPCDASLANKVQAANLRFRWDY